MEAHQPLIFDIGRGSTVDGAGIRTVVFMKGCRLRCSWCHNPESWSGKWGIFYHRDKCIGCLVCAYACSEQAVSFDREKGLKFRKEQCVSCQRCTKSCVSGALVGSGTYYPPEDLNRILMEDRNYYKVSGGGVTFSGGEPLLYSWYIGKTAKLLWEAGISVAFETSGYFDYDAFAKYVRPYTDFVLYDLKLMDEEQHRKYTGIGNKLILDNFDRMKEDGIQIIPRTPQIPGITDTETNIMQIRHFLKQRGMEDRHILLPYNEGGEKKKQTMLM